MLVGDACAGRRCVCWSEVRVLVGDACARRSLRPHEHVPPFDLTQVGQVFLEHFVRCDQDIKLASTPRVHAISHRPRPTSCRVNRARALCTCCLILTAAIAIAIAAAIAIVIVRVELRNLCANSTKGQRWYVPHEARHGRMHQRMKRRQRWGRAEGVAALHGVRKYS